MSKFEAGHAPTPGAGRPKQALGKRARFAMQVMQDEGVEPLAALAKVWRSKRYPFEVRLSCLTAMLPYCYPRLSSVASTSQTDVRMVSMDLLHANPKLAALAEELALQMAVAQPLMLEAPATECIDV